MTNAAKAAIEAYLKSIEGLNIPENVVEASINAIIRSL